MKDKERNAETPKPSDKFSRRKLLAGIGLTGVAVASGGFTHSLLASPNRQDEIGDLHQLLTNDKTNLVSAVNENTTQLQMLQDASFSTVWVNVKTIYGASGDGVTDDTAVIQGAINDLHQNGGGKLYFPAGTYIITAHITLRDNVHLVGDDQGLSTLDFSQKSFFSNSQGFLNLKGQGVIASSPITQPIEQHDDLVTVADSTGFAPGDFVRITSDEIHYSRESTKAEIHRVMGVNGNQIQLSTGAYDSYSTSTNLRLQKLKFARFSMEKLRVIGKGVNPLGDTLEKDDTDANRSDHGLHLEFCRGVVIRDCEFQHIENRVVNFVSCLDVTVDSVLYRFTEKKFLAQYAISIRGCTQNISIVNCSSYNDRHFITTSTSKALSASLDAVRGLPRFITASNNKLNGSWQSALDTHRSAEYVVFSNNVIHSDQTAIKIRCHKAIISNNIIHGKGKNSYAYNATSSNGIQISYGMNDITVSNNQIYGFYQGLRISNADDGIRNIRVTGNRIGGCFNSIRLGASMNDSVYHNIAVTDNTMIDMEGHAIWVTCLTRNLSIQSNTIQVTGNDAIRCLNPVQSIWSVQICNNTIDQVTGSGIRFDSIAGGVISNNSISQCSAHGINIQGTMGKSSQVTGNVLVNTAGIHSNGLADGDSIIERNIVTID